MTEAGFTGVDIDLLADYVGGALEGTPDQTRVAALIVDDPAWQDAYTQLSDGMAEVGDALHAWGAAPEPMPADVIAGLEAALAEMGGGATSPGAGARGVGSNVVDFSERRSRRMMRRGASFAAAAAAVGLAGLGISHLTSGTVPFSSSDNAASSAGSAQARGLAEAATAKILSSGTDYHADGLRVGGEPLSAPKGVNTPSASTLPQAPPTDEVMSTGGQASGLLTRLRPIDALQVCLDAIGADNQAGPLQVQSVDYARFDGKPALVVRFSAANGEWAWVSGPRCGQAGVGADTTYSVRVG